MTRSDGTPALSVPHILPFSNRLLQVPLQAGKNQQPEVGQGSCKRPQQTRQTGKATVFNYTMLCCAAMQWHVMRYHIIPGDVANVGLTRVANNKTT